MAVPGGIDYIRPYIEHVAPQFKGTGALGPAAWDAMKNFASGNVRPFYDQANDWVGQASQQALDRINQWQAGQLDPNGANNKWYQDWFGNYQDAGNAVIGAFDKYVNDMQERLPQTWSEVNAAHPGYEAEVDQRYNALMSKMDPYIQALTNNAQGGGGESGAGSGSLAQQTIAALAPINQWAAGTADAPAAQMRMGVGAGNTALLNAYNAQRAGLYGNFLGGLGALAQNPMGLPNQLAGYSAQMVAPWLNGSMMQGYAQNAMAGPSAQLQPYLASAYTPYTQVITQGQRVGNSANYGPTMGGEYKSPPMGGGSGKPPEGPAAPPPPPGGAPPGYSASGDTAALAQQFVNPYDWVTAAGGGGYDSPPANARPAQDYSAWGDPGYAPPQNYSA